MMTKSKSVKLLSTLKYLIYRNDNYIEPFKYKDKKNKLNKHIMIKETLFKLAQLYRRDNFGIGSIIWGWNPPQFFTPLFV